jgi:hypothetical protein
VKIQIKSAALGFVLASLLALLIVVAGFLFIDAHSRPIFRDQVLPSGKKLKITSFNLAWGVEHEERRPGDDTFALEYVSSVPDADPKLLDQETLEVFELIRPVSEQWGFKQATISAFPTTQRKGKYHIYEFTRAPDGKWTFNRQSAKVYAND